MRFWLLLLFAPGCLPRTSPPLSAASETRWLHDRELWPSVREGLSGTWASAQGEWRLEAHAVARGSALTQTWRSAAGETLNILHRDGDALVLMHLCAQGNQATLRASSADARHIVFDQSSVTNLSDDGSAICHLDLVMTTDQLRWTEQYCARDGTREPPTEIIFRRTVANE